MAKKRKSKLFRGNTTKMLTRGISLPNLYAKIKDLDDCNLRIKVLWRQAALIQEERIEEEVLQKSGQDVWEVADEVDDSPIRIQLGISNQQEKPDAESIEDIVAEENEKITEHLQKKYKAIASITEQNVSHSSRLIF